jgi:transcriptional regulator GlxA family with amidase domain
MEIAIPLHEDFTALDAVGPNEMLGRIPGNTVRWLAHEPGPVRSDSAGLQIVADAAFEDVPHPDIVLVPGGTGTHRFLDDDRILAWLREAHEHSTWTTSVCTGSLLLAAAGILDGVDATTHWTRTEKLERLGARYVKERVVHRGKIVTGAGVSAGIDMALTLAALIHGDDVAKTLQLASEYDPQPPFDAGTPDKAPQHVVDFLRDRALAVSP